MIVEREKSNKELLSGIRALADVPQCEILEEPVFVNVNEEQRWLLKIRLSTEETSEFISQVTSWCVLIDKAYPLGSIEIYPEKKDGIKVTFPHQERNEEGKEDTPWRTGKICVENPFRNIGFPWLSPDPLGDVDMRLRWYIERALVWISAAARNKLVCDGDPFELPQYPELNFKPRVVHDEGREYDTTWLTTNAMVGEVVFESFLPADNTLIAVEFKDFEGNLIRKASFRTEDEIVHGQEEKKTGIWWRWDKPAVIDPWEVPGIWDGLRCVGKKLGVDVDRILRMITRRIRGKDVQLLLIGYPIPLRKGEVPCEMHWYAIKIPQLKEGGKPPNGFRGNEKGWWRRDRTTVFADNNKINYVRTENWHPDRLQARGRMAQPLREMNTLIIGVGALGSVVAELLVRGGMKNIFLVDHDILIAGNFIRHVLTLKNLGANKAKALREHLLAVNPYVKVLTYDKPFPNTKAEIEKFLEHTELVIDCTASDEVLKALSMVWWPVPKLCVSLSIGFKGRRMFIFINDGNRFPAREFMESLQPWLTEKEKTLSEYEETLEGAGCWAPLFPARYDDIMIAAATAIKVIEEAAEKRPVTTQFMVYKQESNNYRFEGFRRVR